MMRRREFIGGMAALGGTGLLGGCRLPGGGADDSSYVVAVLGDTHYDAAPDTVYHAAFRKQFDGTGKHLVRYTEFARNAKMWAWPSRRILEASGACATPDTALVLQVGDLVQGDCRDFATHRRMLGDALAFMRAVYPQELPFVSVCGNHDIRHGGDADDNAADTAYASFMVPFYRAQIGARACGAIDGTTFGFRQGPDLFLAIDFNRGRATVPVVKRILAENADARYTFVVTHGGVFPMDSWGTRWFYLGGRREDAERREVRALLARRNAVVISGHSHYLEFKDAEFPEGRLTEITMNTVFGRGNGAENPAEPQVIREGVANYGRMPWADKPEFRRLFDEYIPHLRQYYLAYAVGHARLRVSDAGVWFDYYGRAAQTVTKSFRLR